MCLSHLETTLPPTPAPSPWKICLTRNQSWCQKGWGQWYQMVREGFSGKMAQSMAGLEPALPTAADLAPPLQRQSFHFLRLSSFSWTCFTAVI